MTTRQIEVQIMGQSYLLGCPDGGEPRLRSAVDRVDATMTRIKDSGKVRARDRIAVLAALNLAVDLADGAASAGMNPLAPPAHSGARSAQAGDDAEAAGWRALLGRLDAALGEDGRLL